MIRPGGTHPTHSLLCNSGMIVPASGDQISTSKLMRYSPCLKEIQLNSRENGKKSNPVMEEIWLVVLEKYSSIVGDT